MRVFLVGLALDFCVRYSAEDAGRKRFAAGVIEEAAAVSICCAHPYGTGGGYL
jgi:nicotinamidase-related amidase